MHRLKRIFRPIGAALATFLGLALLVVAFFYAWDALVGVTAPYTPRREPHPLYPELGTEWVMRPVDNPGDWLPNGLDAADVNGDGRYDYVTNYEFGGRIRVVFHPGTALSEVPWPALDAGYCPNAESAAFGDLDGDGLPDIVIAHGIEHTMQPSGLRVLWGERRAEGTFSWRDGGDIPAGAGGWHFLYVKTADLDSDGDADIVAGGRAARPAGGSREGVKEEASLVWAGLRWFENPGTGRDLTRWLRHDIDAATESGHGFALGDIDGDGDLDIANGNADWDTPDEDENVAWYENPGPARPWPAAWPQHVLYRSPAFYGKEQVVIADLDGDGRSDILTTDEEHILWFRNIGAGPAGAAFELTVIPKPSPLRWRARALQVADMNGDGRPDVIGALIHRDGWLPHDKTAVYWLEQSADGWIPHVIKWGDGFRGLGPFNGEKWDQLLPVDVDGDGALDLVANCEEYNRLRTIIAVVWFENPASAR